MKHCTEPKFDIGQTVRHVAEDANRSLFIVSVISETCPGGTQHTYACRGVLRGVLRGGTTLELVRYNEVELRLATPEELEAEKANSFLAWIGSRKEAAVADKDFELAKSWLVMQDALQQNLKGEA